MLTFSSVAYLCLQQESVTALSRLLEAVTKSTRHAIAMPTILTTEIFQAKRDAALASSKLLLDNSSYELRNVPINSKTLFAGRIKEVAEANYEAQQQRFLASTSSSQPQLHHQKPLNPPGAFKVPKYPVKQTRPKPTQMYRPKTPQSITASNKKDYSRRTGIVLQYLSSKPASSTKQL